MEPVDEKVPLEGIDNTKTMGKGAGQGAVEVHGMNTAREGVGTILDANNVYHGLLRTPHDKFTTFDCPGAGTGTYQGTASHSVNPAGLISAEYFDANSILHGCLRAPNGTFTTLDPPDAGTSYYQGTYPAIFSGIHPEGASVGEYVDNNNMWHGFWRRWYRWTEFSESYKEGSSWTRRATGVLGRSATCDNS
jgi:hypothetical protein